MEVSGKIADAEKDLPTGQTEKLCEPCNSEHATTRANGVCQECREFMCKTCFRHHLKAKQCRNHVLVEENISEVLSKQGEEIIEKCKLHEDETVKYYCRKHEFVGCGDCMILGHGICKPKFIKDLIKDFQENDIFKELLRQHENLTSATREDEMKFKENKREIRLMYETALEEIAKFRTEMNLLLDKADKDMKIAVERLKSENEDILTKLEEECKLLTTKIDTVKQAINTEIYQGRMLFMRSVECKTHIRDIKRDMAQLRSRNSVRKFTFTRDKTLSNVIACKFGYLDINQSGQVCEEAKESKLISYARVRPFWSCTYGKGLYHCWNPGTVTAVDRDGNLTVKWDHTGRTLKGFVLGCTTMGNGVELI